METHTKLSIWAFGRPSLKMNKSMSMRKWDSPSGKITILLTRISKTEASYHMERLYHQKLRVKIRTSDILKLRSIPSNNYMTTITSTRNLFMIMGKGMIRITIMIKIQGTIKMQFMTKMRLTIRMPHTTKTQLMTKTLPMIKMPYTIKIMNKPDKITTLILELKKIITITTVGPTTTT